MRCKACDRLMEQYDRDTELCSQCLPYADEEKIEDLVNTPALVRDGFWDPKQEES